MKVYMLPFELPYYPELMEGRLTEEERLAIMPLSTQKDKDVDEFIFRSFVFAVSTNSSDVHISGHGSLDHPDITINIRKPGGLVNYMYTGSGDKKAFLSKMFKLTNTPQGGSTPEILSTRFSMEFPIKWAWDKGLVPKKGRAKYYIDVRVEYAKTFDGFAFTCRILDQQRSPEIDELGLSYALEVTLKKIIREPSGLILVSGPTGSGKTTLLNAVLGYLNNGQNSIVTIENPVEFRLQGDGPIKQIQVHGDVTFAKALRSTLRQDPDIILIGEIRDPETMEIALQAAQTGHLVLSTLHANSAADTFSRALDLTFDKKRDALRIADTLKLVMAQRLIDRYERNTSHRPITKQERAWLTENGVTPPQFVHETISTKKEGKIALIEAIEVDFRIRGIIKSENMDTDSITKYAASQLHHESLVMAGLRAVESGQARMTDCQNRLETNPAASTFTSLRTGLVNKFNVSYEVVNGAIDHFVSAQNEGHETSIEDILIGMKEKAA